MLFQLFKVIFYLSYPLFKSFSLCAKANIILKSNAKLQLVCQRKYDSSQFLVTYRKLRSLFEVEVSTILFDKAKVTSVLEVYKEYCSVTLRAYIVDSQSGSYRHLRGRFHSARVRKRKIWVHTIEMHFLRRHTPHALL